MRALSIPLLFLTTATFANEGLAGSHVKVAMRMIGHEVLLSVGDSTSRVLPIEKEGEGYRIRFASHFQFDPEALGATIDRVMAETRIATGYLVEVQQCDSDKVVYSYEVGILPDRDLIACKERLQPMGCYSLFITLVAAAEAPAALSVPQTDPTPGNDRAIYAGSAVLVLALLAMLGFARNKRRQKGPIGAEPQLIPIGAYRFDPRNMQLVLGEEKNELTSKEADLLFLLHSSANTTVERDVILNNVWGDQGDYVGRTLDVFISKLRKKLEADPTIKIVNTRGVGYKLVVNDGPT